MSLRQLLLPYVSALLLAALGPCASHAASAAEGSTVTWTNKDDEPHTVASEGGLFRSAALDTNESFSFRFDKPGTYRYTCSIHPRMTGTVVVR